MELLIWILLILGLVGALVPVIPGPIISSLGLVLALIYQDIDGLLIYFLIAGGFVIFCLDLILPSVITKKSGGSKRAATGALIGMLLSIFTGPGLVLGAFIGAFIRVYMCFYMRFYRPFYRRFYMCFYMCYY